MFVSVLSGPTALTASMSTRKEPEPEEQRIADFKALVCMRPGSPEQAQSEGSALSLALAPLQRPWQRPRAPGKRCFLPGGHWGSEGGRGERALRSPGEGQRGPGVVT